MRRTTRNTLILVVILGMLGGVYYKITQNKDQAAIRVAKTLGNIYRGVKIEEGHTEWEIEEINKVIQELQKRDEYMVEIEKEGMGESTVEQEEMESTMDSPDAAEVEYMKLQEGVEPDVEQEEPRRDLANTKEIQDNGSTLEIALTDLVFEYGSAEVYWDDIIYIIYETEVPKTYKQIIESKDYDYTLKEIIDIGRNIKEIRLVSEGTQKIKPVIIDTREQTIDASSLGE